MYLKIVIFVITFMILMNEIKVKSEILEQKWKYIIDMYEDSAQKDVSSEQTKKLYCDLEVLDRHDSFTDKDQNSKFRGIKWKVILKYCVPQRVILASHEKLLLLYMSAHGLWPGSITKLELMDIPSGAMFNANHFKGLDWIETLKVHTTVSDRPQQLEEDFLVPLTNVSWLWIENEALPPLPKDTGIAFAILTGGRSIGSWGGCRDLRMLHLNDWYLPQSVKEDRNWLSKCLHLKYLKAERMEYGSLKAVLDSNNPELIEMQLQNNNLTTQMLADVLRNERVISLGLSSNKLTHIDPVLKKLRRVGMLNMSYNMISDFGNITRALHTLPNVHHLCLDHNPLQNHCNISDLADKSKMNGTKLPRLRELSLVGTGVSELCFAEWTTLRFLNLTDNNIEELQFSHLPSLKDRSELTVDLRRNPLIRVNFTENDYYALKGGRNTSPNDTEVKAKVLNVYTDSLPPFHCDCQNGWLGRALRENLITLSTDMVCHSGGSLSAIPPTILECDVLPCAPCRCVRQWPGSGVSLNCESKSFKDIIDLPKLQNLSEMHLRGNDIDSISVEDLPITVKFLDLRDNNITRLDVEIMEQVLKVPNRQVWLAGNPLVCDCDNWPLLATLRVHRHQVDYENITCGLDGPSLYDVSQEQLCGVGIWPGVSAGGGIVVGLAALGGVLYTRYEQELKTWLYINGWCLCCIIEKELDADREYDAFLSYAHGDHEFVATKLLPELENDQRGYKVCVHYRDWIPGELIPTQIARSVASSRRTVIILSANFVKSAWGLMEFRAAHIGELAERRVRVLVVALDDVPPLEELPEELRLYLRSTTYLKWDDPWFWDKFRYALPHRTSARSGEKRCSRVETQM